LLDYNRTLWSRFISNIVYDTPSTFQPNLGNSFDWNDSWKIRLGARYKTSDKNEIFGGYAYDVPALDERSIDFSTTVDVYMNRFSVGMAHEWSERFETSVGILAGYGERTVGNVEYRLTGYQIMVENRFGSAH
jgi:long-subunit fatty acid transport protein